VRAKKLKKGRAVLENRHESFSTVECFGRKKFSIFYAHSTRSLTRSSLANEERGEKVCSLSSVSAFEVLASQMKKLHGSDEVKEVN
jgi:hypothetical protein